jgi:ComF family protein
MYFIFLQKIINTLKIAFDFIFCNNDLRLESLERIEFSSWQRISNPQILKSGVIHIWDYNHKHIRDALYYIKNKQNVKLLEALTKVTCDYVLEELAEACLIDNSKDVLLLNVPSNNKSIKIRGYNPSEEIAKQISDHTGIPHLKNILMKTKDTVPQKTLKRSARLRNVHRSMLVNPKNQKFVLNKYLIVVDDIVTTGATLAECKRALIRSGARKVICIALAH